MKGHLRNIVYVIGQLSVGGMEKHLASTVRRIDRDIYQPHVVCLSGQGKESDAGWELNCPVYWLGPRIARGPRTLFSLYRLLRAIRPDIVHAFGRPVWQYAILAARWSGVRSVIATHQGIGGWRRWYHPWAARILLTKVDMGIFNAVAVRKAIWDHLGLPIHRTRVIYSALDTEEFDQQAEMGLTSLPPAGLQVSNGSPVICAVANANPVKSLDVLILAHKLVIQRRHNSQLWIVGDGQLRRQLEEMAKSTDVGGRVHFWGSRSDVPAILKDATVGVLSSQGEGASNALLEYMAASLPVVATDVGGNPELVTQDETGLLVPPQSPEALASAILSLLDQPKLRARMGRAGRRRVEAKFSIDKMVSDTEAAYGYLLEGAKGPSPYIQSGQHG